MAAAAGGGVMEYIEREATIQAASIWNGDESTEAWIKSALKKLPAADVRPVVRGRWIDAIQSCHDSPHVKCSVCSEYYWQYFKKFSFCPNCGADMREES